MSNNEWEAGTIKLPSTEFARLRKAVQAADHEAKTKAFEMTQTFWKSLSKKETTDKPAFDMALNRYFQAASDQNSHTPMRMNGFRNSMGSRVISDNGINSAIEEAVSLSYQNMCKRVLKSDVDFPTNRTTSFQAGEAEIFFDKQNNSVKWDVSENNHSVDRAYETSIAKTFFKALKDVKWTRGTGGTFSYNSEYNEDEHGHQDGSSISRAFGPVGAEEALSSCEPYTDSKGNRIGEFELRAMRHKQIKDEAAMYRRMEQVSAQPRGHQGHAGQYTYRSRGDSGLRLR